MSNKAMGNPRILVFGEVLVDLFINKSSNIKGFSAFDCVGLPGGAPCNVAANLVKCGSVVEFVTAFGDDLAGKELYAMLGDRGVGLNYCLFPKQSSTPLATVSNEENGQNTFRIYMEGSAYSSFNVQSFDWKVLEQTNWVHLGSVLMSQENTREVTLLLAQQASKLGSLVSYDINIRPNILSKHMEGNCALIDILYNVDLLKLSDEDFSWLKENILPDISDPSDLFAYGCSVIAWTHGAEGSTIITPQKRIKVPSLAKVVKDTTGAGDAFTAGLIHYLASNGIYSHRDIKGIIGNGEVLKNAGMFAAALASEVIAHQGALPRLA